MPPRSSAVALLCVAASAFGQSAPTEESPPRFARGDTWIYREFDCAGGTVTIPSMPERVTVAALGRPGEPTVLNDGHVVLDDSGDYVQLYGWSWEPGISRLKFPMKVGSSWSSRYTWKNPGGGTGAIVALNSVQAFEKVRVPAGEFDAYRILATVGSRDDGMPRSTMLEDLVWYAPRVKRIVKRELTTYLRMSRERLCQDLREFRLRDGTGSVPQPTAPASRP